MKIENEPVTIIRCEIKSGTSKTGKAYSIPEVEFADSNYDKFRAVVPKSALVDGVVPEWLLDAENLKAEMDIEVKPVGFGAGVRILEIREAA